MRFLIVDAFTESVFGGNPAGIVILDKGMDFPSDEIMVKTAAELRYSETAFIKQLGEKEFNIRYFTPAAEVELCGHATIGSFAAMLHLGMIKDNDIYMNHTLSGDLNIKVENGYVMMDMASPVKINEISTREAIDELYEIMGVKYDESLGLIPQMISTGLIDIMMPVKDEVELEKIDPDMKALTELSRKYEVVGVHAFTADVKAVEIAGEDQLQTHARNFAPLYDIDEEAATGTSNGALTYYFYLNDMLLPSKKCKVIQGEKMQRPSVIMTSLEEKADGQLIQVGGSAVVLAEGEIYL
ncbi:MAG: PhzF family phenazine biosynthesis protein [Clostridia bacterium]|nr:PhzF family phenazine biosynthesis protein [Clostridia bacterium]